jgi:two-component system nitrate/nitrite response regulator NarL
MSTIENDQPSTASSPAPILTVHDQTAENRIRLLLFHHHGLFRASLAKLLASESGFEVVRESNTAGETLEILSSSPVDVILLDFDLGPQHAIDFISASRKAGYQGRFLIVTGTADAASSARALKLGASGVFLKSEVPERLIQAIRLIAAGGLWVDQKIVQLLADQCLKQPQQTDQKSGNALQDRQQRVLLGVLSGLKNRDIANGMGISESSVKNILQGLFIRTGVRTRSQLVRLALEGSLGNVRQLVKQHEKKMNSGDTPSRAESHDVTT